MKALQCISLFLLLVPNLFIGQKIDNTATFRDIKSSNYVRLNYENDVFSSTDEDYSQGLNLELVSPFFKKNPLNTIFINPKKNETRYGIAIEHLGYTADDIASYEIQYGDRPYAGVFMLKSFAVSTDTINKSRVASSLSIGIIGQGAGSGNMQRFLHEIIGSAIPNGWYYQIKNDLVLNYDISYEKQLLRFDNFFMLNSNANVKLGTLFTNASVGLNASLGIINSPFSSANNKNKFQLYIYSQGLVNVIGYDATLQGGLINDKSVYTIPNGDIERFTAQNNFGIVLQYRCAYLEFSHTLLTREISTSNPHSWGSIHIGFKL